MANQLRRQLKVGHLGLGLRSMGHRSVRGKVVIIRKERQGLLSLNNEKRQRTMKAVQPWKLLRA